MREAKLMVFRSREDLGIGLEIENELSGLISTTIWDDFLFQSYKSPLGLFDEIKNKDFAIFIFSDKDRIREKKFGNRYGNLNFELGLLIGKIGRDRVFILDASNDNRDFLPPTLLLGIQYYYYSESSKSNIIGRLKSTILKTSQKDELYYPEEFRNISTNLEKYLSNKQKIKLIDGHFYTNSISNIKANNLYNAFQNVLTENGIDVILNYKEKKGSWWKKFIGGLKDNDKLTKKLEEAEHAIKLAAIDKVQSEIDKNQSESAANLSAAAKDVDSCVFKIGSLLYVKYVDPNGKKILQCRSLTRDEILMLERNPDFLNSPEKILAMIEGPKDDNAT